MLDGFPATAYTVEARMLPSQTKTAQFEREQRLPPRCTFDRDVTPHGGTTIIVHSSLIARCSPSLTVLRVGQQIKSWLSQSVQ
jgi:hypothetical protein